MTLAARLALAETLVADAGEMIRAALAAPHLSVSAKGPGDVVTETDFAIERAMRAAIGMAFPEDGIIGEELGSRLVSDGYTWLIDPVDGTVNFARRLGYFCVSVALLQNGVPVAAWILDPTTRELFHAGPDRIVRVNRSTTLCAETASLGDALIGLGFSTRHDPALYGLVVDAVTRAGAEHRRLGAGALCLAHVAAGRLEAYVEPHMNPWDAIGGLYLAACSGAVTCDYIGADGLRDGAPVYAAAPKISADLLAALPALFSGTPLHRENEARSAGEVAS